MATGARQYPLGRLARAAFSWMAGLMIACACDKFEPNLSQADEIMIPTMQLHVHQEQLCLPRSCTDCHGCCSCSACGPKESSAAPCKVHDFKCFGR